MSISVRMNVIIRTSVYNYSYLFKHKCKYSMKLRCLYKYQNMSKNTHEKVKQAQTK